MHEGDESTTIFSVEATRQMYSQTNEFEYLRGNVNHNANLSIEANRRIRNARRVTWSLRACHYDTLRRAHYSFLTRCIGWRKNNRAGHPLSYLDTLMKRERESIEATLRRRRIWFVGFVPRMEDTRLPKCVMFGEIVGGPGCVGGQKKEWMGCFLDDLRAFGINADQWTAAVQDEGEWCRTAEQGARRFMAKWIAADKARATLRHAVVYPNVTGRTKERIAQSKRARAGSLATFD